MLIDKELECCLQTVKAFERAAELLQEGNGKKAMVLVMGLPEASYDLGLLWYERNRQDYFYYLARYVLASLECDSDQLPSKEDIAEYWSGLVNHSQRKPVKVWLNGYRYDIDWQKCGERGLQVA